MKTLIDSLIEEFNLLITSGLDTDQINKNIDYDKLRRIYRQLLLHRDEKDDFDSAARTLVNSILNNEFQISNHK